MFMFFFADFLKLNIGFCTPTLYQRSQADSWTKWEERGIRKKEGKERKKGGKGGVISWPSNERIYVNEFYALGFKSSSV